MYLGPQGHSLSASFRMHMPYNQYTERWSAGAHSCFFIDFHGLTRNLIAVYLPVARDHLMCLPHPHATQSPWRLLVSHEESASCLRYGNMWQLTWSSPRYPTYISVEHSCRHYTLNIVTLDFKLMSVWLNYKDHKPTYPRLVCLGL